MYPPTCPPTRTLTHPSQPSSPFEQLNDLGACGVSPLLALGPTCSMPGRALLPEPLFPLPSCGCSPLSPSPLPNWRPLRTAAARVLPLGGGAGGGDAERPWPRPDAGCSSARAVLAGAFPSAAARGAPRGDRPPRRVRLAGPAAAASAAAAAGGLGALSAAAAAPVGAADLAAAAAVAVTPRRSAAKRSRPPAGAAAGASDCDSPTAKRRPVARLMTRPHGLGCVECGATSTPVWRSGPAGPKTLCNRCGVRLSKLARRKL
jgi:hypothetical protein